MSKPGKVSRWASGLTLALLVTSAVCCARPEVATEGVREPRPPLELTAEVDRAVATVGDLITYTVTMDREPDVSLQVPEFGDTLAEFRVVDAGTIGPEEKYGRVILKKWYRMQADIIGSYLIDSAIVRYTVPDGEQRETQTPRLFIEVESILEEGETARDIRDLKAPEVFKRDYTIYLWILLGLAIVIALTLALWAYVRRKAREEVELVRRPAHEIAYEALERLRLMRLVEHGKVKEYYFALSEILRQYLEDRFELKAVEQTTEETVSHIEGTESISDETKDLTKQFLSETDLVKFAKYSPSADEIEWAQESAKRLVDETKEETYDLTARAAQHTISGTAVSGGETDAV